MEEQYEVPAIPEAVGILKYWNPDGGFGFVDVPGYRCEFHVGARAFVDNADKRSLARVTKRGRPVRVKIRVFSQRVPQGKRPTVANAELICE